MKYDVHVYAVVRVKCPGIEAESQKDAIRKVEDVDLNRLFANPSLVGGNVSQVEYADEDAYFLVDEEGDDDRDRSVWYDCGYNILPLCGQSVTTH